MYIKGILYKHTTKQGNFFSYQIHIKAKSEIELLKKFNLTKIITEDIKILK